MTSHSSNQIRYHRRHSFLKRVLLNTMIVILPSIGCSAVAARLQRRQQPSESRGGAFDGHLAPFPTDCMVHIVNLIGRTCNSSSLAVAWSPSRFIAPRRVTTTVRVTTSPLLLTKHFNQLVVNNDGITSAAVLAYLLSYVLTWVKRVVPGNGNHGGCLILNLYSKYHTR